MHAFENSILDAFSVTGTGGLVVLSALLLLVVVQVISPCQGAATEVKR